jgi:hypothetical protein
MELLQHVKSARPLSERSPIDRHAELSFGAKTVGD